MTIVWKLDHPIDVIDSALAHHLGILRREVNRQFSLEFQDHYSDSAVRVYDLQYFQGGASHTSDDNLGRIKLRKLSEHRTEITISDSYWSVEGESRQSLYSYFRTIEYDNDLSEETIEKMISDRETIREKILEKLRNGFEDDGLLIASDKNIQRVESVTSKFIDDNRLKELRSLTPQKFDLSKLLKLCEEINSSYENKNYYSVAMLLRALLDHIPPIFGFETFEQMVAQYGNKSFKENMTHLDKSLRKIADSYLHLPIRTKEILPNKNQVNFSADLDVLLAEIVRLLK